MEVKAPGGPAFYVTHICLRARVHDRGLAGLGATGHEDVEARHDARVQEARGRGGECAEDYQLVEMVRPHDELANVHGPVFGSDVGDDHMQAAAIRKHCVDKGAREVDTFDLPYVIRRDRRESSPPQRSLDRT